MLVIFSDPERVSFFNMPLIRTTNQSTVVLLLGKQDDSGVDDWLVTNYRASEAADAFQVLDQLSDFTVREVPKMMYLHLDETRDDHVLVRRLLMEGIDEGRVTVIDAVESSMDGAFDLPMIIRKLSRQLDQFLVRAAATH